MIAQELALLAPQRVASLALLATYSSALLAMPTMKALLDLARSTGLLTRDLREQGQASMRLNFPQRWLEEKRLGLGTAKPLPSKEAIRSCTKARR